jgi:hypothetical protein
VKAAIERRICALEQRQDKQRSERG